jgi:hypothetical protein
VISIAEDSNMFVYSIEASGDKSAKQHKLNPVQRIELDSELYQIVSNSVDRIALGGEPKKVDVHSIPSGVIDKDSFAMP